MVQIAHITGVDEVINNLRKFSKDYQKKVSVGMKLGGKFLWRKSLDVVPVDKDILKPSGYTRATGKGFDTVVTVGYTTSYAIYVHEDLTARHKPGKTAKYLENPARENRDRILEIIWKASRL